MENRRRGDKRRYKLKQLRICGLGDYSNYYSYFLYGIMEGAIRNGAWFRPISLRGQTIPQIESQINFFRPHIILCHMIFNKERQEGLRELFKRIKKRWGTVVFYHMGDAREEPRYCGDISEYVDYGLINHQMNKEFELHWKIPTFHFPYFCFYQKEIVDRNKKIKGDVIFTGKKAREPEHVHYKRTMFIEELQKKLKGGLVTYPNLEIKNTRFLTAELSASAKVVLGYQMRKQIPGYVDVRPFQYIGAGALFFHDRSKQIDLFFERGEHFVDFKRGSVDDFISKYKYYCRNKKEANKIREKGFIYCQNYHSTKERMEFIIDLYYGREVKHRIYKKDLP